MFPITRLGLPHWNAIAYSHPPKTYRNRARKSLHCSSRFSQVPSAKSGELRQKHDGSTPDGQLREDRSNKSRYSLIATPLKVAKFTDGDAATHAKSP